jgi:hypothetical protein
MHETNRLANLILEHWRIHLPQMVAELQRTNRLTQAVEAAESRASDLLYEFLSVRKMQYPDAWELAMRECLLPPQSSPMNPRSSLPVTSG